MNLPMRHDKQIAIILPDTLRSTGLQSLLADYFPPVEICHFPSFELFSNASGDAFDYFFTDPETFVLNADFFLPRRNKTGLLIDSADTETPLATNKISVKAPQETILDQLQHLFASDNAPIQETNKELTSREIDVLQLIVKGITNKEIADKLSISLNTVLSHRKNITSKLGIKTVSGLTFYAIMNGIISGEEIEL